MTVRTQKPDVVSIGGPVLEAPLPSVARAVSYLRRLINVVNVQNAMVGNTALLAFTSELGNECQFSFPVPVALMCTPAVSVPMDFLTKGAAKSSFGRLSAGAALAAPRPTRGEVARLRTIFPGAIFDAVGVRAGALAAMCARYWHSVALAWAGCADSFVPRWWPISVVARSGAVFSVALAGKIGAALDAHMPYRFHCLNVVVAPLHSSFDIACRRIEQAQRQADLFIAPPAIDPEDQRVADLFAEPAE